MRRAIDRDKPPPIPAREDRPRPDLQGVITALFKTGASVSAEDVTRAGFRSGLAISVDEVRVMLDAAAADRRVDRLVDKEGRVRYRRRAARLAS